MENPRKRRDRLEIIARILKVARDDIHKTQIMYHAGLSFAQSTGYLSFLVKSGLLEAIKKNEKVIYKTTAKGIRYLKSYEEIKRLLRKSNEHNVPSLGLPFSFPKRST
ncbi:MAG: winged helix-turn-helix domain-containing protein [Candidatus Bathyarchaeota archaeon]|nr:winged helix-turn-helix domain-containing protein [Candidatus Bathyarchaeota archaeon]